MGSMNLIQYNLSKISEIDKQLLKNNEEKDKFLNYHTKRHKIYNFLEKLTDRTFQTMMIILSTVISYVIFKDPINSAIISINFIVFVNLILMIFITMYETKEDFLTELCTYRKKHNDLMKKRGYYINLYNYALKGDQTILNNIKLRINNGSYCEYDNLKDFDIKNNSYEYKTLKIMSKKEKMMKESIKNKVYFELNSPVRSENLSTEELNTIQNAL